MTLIILPRVASSLDVFHHGVAISLCPFVDVSNSGAVVKTFVGMEYAHTGSERGRKRLSDDEPEAITFLQSHARHPDRGEADAQLCLVRRFDSAGYFWQGKQAMATAVKDDQCRRCASEAMKGRRQPGRVSRQNYRWVG